MQPQKPQKPLQSGMTKQQLLKFDFGTLSQRQLQLIDNLSSLSIHNSIYRILTNPYGDQKTKQQLVKQNLSALSSDDQAQYNISRSAYYEKSKTFPPFIIGSFTLGAYLTGVWRLPSRKSTILYTFSGLGLGITVSYGMWRYWAYQYYDKLNYFFQKVLVHNYTQNKRKNRQMNEMDQMDE